MKCPENWCKSEDIINVTGRPSRTPGFHPNYECKKCGLRWIERTGTPLRELHEAVKEMRSLSGDTGSSSSTVRRSGRREA